MQYVRGTINKVLNPTVTQTPAFIDGVTMPVCLLKLSHVHIETDDHT